MRDTYRGTRGEIPLGIFVRQSLLQHLDADDIFEVTKQGFEYFENAFDMAYPFGKYDQLFVPEYNMGAMENAGCVTFRDEYIFRSRQTRAAYEGRANTILHEMAHMWFGDLVTMKWWDDLWLNESFAEWAAHQASVDATQYDEAWTNFCNARKTWAYRQDQLPSTHPIAADNHDLEAVEVNFDGITYAKGASALRQLVAWVGPGRVLRRPAASTSTGTRTATPSSTDLLKALEETSGRELGLVDQGVAADVGRQHRPAGLRGRRPTARSRRSSIEQTAHRRLPDPAPAPAGGRPLRPAPTPAWSARSSVEIDVSGARDRACPSWSARQQPDLVLLNDGDLTYAKVRLDERSLATAGRQHRRASPTRCRGRLSWGAAWDMTRDAEMRASDWVDLVLRGIGVETDLFAVRSLVARTAPGGRAVHRARQPRRDVARALGGTGCSSLVRGGRAGQRPAARLRPRPRAGGRLRRRARLCFRACSTAPSSSTASRSTPTCAGSCCSGWPGKAAPTTRPSTTSSTATTPSPARSTRPRPGRRCRRPRPRHRPGREAVERDDVPNETMRSIAFALQPARPGRGAASRTSPSTSRWPTTSGRSAACTTPRPSLVGMFPTVLATPGDARHASTRGWLSTSANPAARRLVSEGRDDVARALAAQRATRQVVTQLGSSRGVGVQARHGAWRAGQLQRCRRQAAGQVAGRERRLHGDRGQCRLPVGQGLPDVRASDDLEVALDRVDVKISTLLPGRGSAACSARQWPGCRRRCWPTRTENSRPDARVGLARWPG